MSRPVLIARGDVKVMSPRHGLYVSDTEHLGKLAQAYYSDENATRRKLAHYVTVSLAGQGDYYDCDELTLLGIAAELNASPVDLAPHLASITDEDISKHMAQLGY